jgi:hypothetical protein
MLLHINGKSTMEHPQFLMEQELLSLPEHPQFLMEQELLSLPEHPHFLVEQELFSLPDIYVIVCDAYIRNVMTSTSPRGTLGSVSSLLAATL